MEHLGNQFGVEDIRRCQCCASLHGMPLLAAGQALESPFFVMMSRRRSPWKSSSPRRQRGASLKRVKLMAESGSPELAQAIWGKTMKEGTGGTWENHGRALHTRRNLGQAVNMSTSFQALASNRAIQLTVP